jgi:spore cortex formation protein SpoVR/YcgB (stage V sporulation)
MILLLFIVKLCSAQCRLNPYLKVVGYIKEVETDTTVKKISIKGNICDKEYILKKYYKNDTLVKIRFIHGCSVDKKDKMFETYYLKNDKLFYYSFMAKDMCRELEIFGNYMKYYVDYVDAKKNKSDLLSILNELNMDIENLKKLK